MRNAASSKECHYPTDDWLNMVCTYSNVLTLEPQTRAELRARLARSIGDGGVRARNDAVAVVCRLRHPTPN